MLALIVLVLVPQFLAACADPPPLFVDQAWIRVSPNKDTPSAGYFVVHGGEAAVELRGVMTDRALRVEMHESVEKDGKMTMQPIDSVAVAANTQVAFAPGGKHIMLWGVNPEAIAQGKVPLTFLFSNGDRIIVDAVVQKAGAAGSTSAEHSGH
ncbi:copper chaperone PCu(A)C [Sphingobium algorifonticola]|uniref:Copper chaperone PCu(A)C n=2 Tax=Sphingobium algorifonticola TaxID=2008318 RepID=A0A437J598_9SPHN|nr:copper chaperone PCu(A)C [Sphingobium algorifonticola]